MEIIFGQTLTEKMPLLFRVLRNARTSMNDS